MTLPENPPGKVKQTSWGRTGKAKWQDNLAAVLVIAGPIWMLLNWTALNYFDGSLFDCVQALFSPGALEFRTFRFPKPSLGAALGYVAWVALQAVLYAFLPGQKCSGQRTPGGYLLSYTVNGIMAWTITHLVFLALSVLGLLDPAIIAKNWDGLLIAANVYGFLLGVFVLLKAYHSPSYPEDCKLSGSWVFDFWGGIELNPRLGKSFDLKLFHNGRPGIVAWTLIDISFAAYQHQIHGEVTNSMLIVLTLHAIYVVDFFFNEDWYTRTIDITHDHFGFMLAWGDTTFLPAFYTLQAQYLARYPTHLTQARALIVLSIGLTGYTIFRLANHQRDYVRSQDGDAILWGRPATFMRCTYRTEDGKEHQSILLISGWWGISRHLNYLADMSMAFAMCATCGFSHLLPWSYFVYMCVLLCNRAERDEQRCRNKYGRQWEEYCKKVPYRLVPGLY